MFYLISVRIFISTSSHSSYVWNIQYIRVCMSKIADTCNNIKRCAQSNALSRDVGCKQLNNNKESLSRHFYILFLYLC